MKIPGPTARQDFLKNRRNMKMARSPHAYMRGNTEQYYAWLKGNKGQALPEGPSIWLCGDCHIGNLGPVGDINGHVELAIRDLDQTVIGNPSHDLVRLALSLATAARGSSLPGIVTAKMLEQVIWGYQQAFAAGKDKELLFRPESIQWVLRKAIKRSWKQMATERIVDVNPSIPLGKNFWSLSRSEKGHIAKLFTDETALELVRSLKSRGNHEHVKVVDAAYWVKGCSSLGLLRYAVLLSVGRKGNNEYCLMDVKQAIKTVAPRNLDKNMPRDNARRVVAGARQLTPTLGDRMLARRFLGRSVFIRELLPQDTKLEIDRMTIEEATEVARYLAYIVGKAHARQMDEATQERWRNEIHPDQNKKLTAPTWLWDSVVQLLADHEVGYLEHCRRYASSTK